MALHPTSRHVAETSRQELTDLHIRGDIINGADLEHGDRIQFTAAQDPEDLRGYAWQITDLADGVDPDDVQFGGKAAGQMAARTATLAANGPSGQQIRIGIHPYATFRRLHH